ncbi:MoaD/ThiS family protein [Thermodesulfobacteriota bacterium]
MGVKINIPHFWQHLTNDMKSIEVNGLTVGECLNGLLSRFPSLKERIFDKESKLLNKIGIYVNGKSSYPDELIKPVNDGDEIHILLVLAGG